jgi:uncharacterized protein YbbK (DUF523 family)
LLGENCKYSGGNNKCEKAIELGKYFDLIPVCPEFFGELPIPREPSEIKDGKVFTKSGKDVTANFVDGANKTLYVAREGNCPVAILKENSPSCGFGKVYDGSFTGTLCTGNGITAQLLSDNEIMVFGESKIDKFLQFYL